MIDAMRCRRFHTLYEVAKFNVVRLLKHSVNVIWHDAPRDQSVALAVVSEKSGLDNFGAIAVAEKTLAVAIVEQVIAVNR